MQNDFIREKCLSCKFAREIMKSYMIVIRELNENNIDNLQEYQKVHLNKLATFLELGNISDAEKFNQIKQIFDNSGKDNLKLYDRVEYDYCITSIVTLIHEMNNFFTRKNVFAYKKMTGSFFKEICDSFPDNSNISQNAKFIKKYISKLKQLEEKVDKNCTPSEKLSLPKLIGRSCITPEEYVSIKRICLCIFDSFIEIEPITWKIEKHYGCMLIDAIQAHEDRLKMEQTYERFLRHYHKLSDENKELMDRFILRLPTNAGQNLSHVMKAKGIKESMIVNLIRPHHPRALVSDIQELKRKREIEEDERFNRLLCRVLLVDRDVLFTGTGKSFGNWFPYYKGEKEIGDIWNIARKNVIFESDQGNARKRKKASFCSDLANILDEDISVEEFVQKYQYLNIFYEEEFSVFKTKYEDGFEDESEDKIEHFNALLDKNAVYALLEALNSKMQH